MQDGKPPDGEGVSAGAGYDERLVRLFSDRMAHVHACDPWVAPDPMMPVYFRESTD